MLRLLWACLRWDDMAAKPPPGGGITRTGSFLVTYCLVTYCLFNMMPSHATRTVSGNPELIYYSIIDIGVSEYLFITPISHHHEISCSSTNVTQINLSSAALLLIVLS